MNSYVAPFLHFPYSRRLMKSLALFRELPAGSKSHQALNDINSIHLISNSPLCTEVLVQRTRTFCKGLHLTYSHFTISMVRIYTDIEAFRPMQVSSACLSTIFGVSNVLHVLYNAMLRPSLPTSHAHLHRLYSVMPARFGTYLASANNTTLVSNGVAQLSEKAWSREEIWGGVFGTNARRCISCQSLRHHISSYVAMP